LSASEVKWLTAIFGKIDKKAQTILRPDDINAVIFYKSDPGDVLQELMNKFRDYKGKLPGIAKDPFLSFCRYEVDRGNLKGWINAQIDQFELKGKKRLNLRKPIKEQDWQQFYSRQARLQEKHNNWIAGMKMDLLSAELEELQSKPTIGKTSAKMMRDQLPMSQRVYTVITDHNQLIADTIEAAQQIEEDAIEDAYLAPPAPRPLHEARAYAQHLIDYAREHEHAVDKMRQKQLALEAAHTTFQPQLGAHTQKLAKMRASGQETNTFDRLYETPTESAAERIKATHNNPQRPKTAPLQNDLRAQMERFLDRLDDLEIRRLRPENRHKVQQKLFDEEKETLERELATVRDRLDRQNRRMGHGPNPALASPSSPDSCGGSPPARERTQALLASAPSDKTTRVNVSAVKNSNRMYYDAVRTRERKRETTHQRLSERGLRDNEIDELLKPGGRAIYCTETGWGS